MSVPILSPDQLSVKLPQGYVATVTKIPLGLDTQHPMRDCFDDRSIAVANQMGAIWCHVEDHATGVLVATAVFAADAQVVRCDTVDVAKGYQKKGVATAIYKIASSIFAAPVVPSGNLSPDAKLFWGTKTQII